MPYEDAVGAPQMRMWSFLCGIGSIFDQVGCVNNCDVIEMYDIIYIDNDIKSYSY